MSIDQDTKLRIKAALLEHLEQGLASLTGQESSEGRAGRLDPATSLEVDDTSHSDEARDLENLLGRAAGRSRSSLDAARGLDFATVDRVGPGAVVGFAGARYVVGVATGAFECDGATYEGIGSDSPVYPLIQGKHAGDSFTYRGEKHSIDFVG